jgi:hypothetical protein
MENIPERALHFPSVPLGEDTSSLARLTNLGSKGTDRGTSGPFEELHS